MKSHSSKMFYAVYHNVQVHITAILLAPSQVMMVQKLLLLEGKSDALNAHEKEI